MSGLLTRPTPPTADYAIVWHTIDGGGEMRSTGGSYELSGTIGQHDAGEMSGGTYSLTGGFWFGLVPGDCDADGGETLEAAIPEPPTMLLLAAAILFLRKR